ncbi:MAG: asparagine synthase (glutamine-hydrolyzing) [bacterium]
MCGIGGIINLDQKPVNRKNIERMMELVDYRGPDDEGYFIDKNIALGHRRLSIVDLSSAGHQPMQNKTGTLCIVYNGEIYNYLELKGELEEKGHRFKSKTDTEVIIHAYEEWKESCFKKFNGDWAIAIADLADKKVILSRDRFSVKPLYYATLNKSFYFASEIKQILPFLEKKEPNQDVLFKYLKQGLIDFNQETFYKGIYKVKPRHNLIIDLINGEMEEREYWDYSTQGIEIGEDEAVEKFRELFINSVKIRLRSDVPIGILLSGGLDSSSISVIASELSSNQISCFSVVSKDKKYSEEQFIDILKDKKHLKVQKLFLDSKTVWNNLEKISARRDEPFGGLSAVVQNQMLELIKKETNIKVLLSGQGGDEILCGYRKFFFLYLQEEMKKGHVFSVFENTFSSLIGRTALWHFSLAEAKRYIPFFQKYNDPVDDILKIGGELEQLWQFKNLRKRQIIDIDKYSVPALTHYEDRNSMQHSLEIRLPFLDYRLVDFVLSLPYSLKIKNGWTKYLLRKSIAELPKEITWRKDKQGFISPEEKWLKHDFRDKIVNLFKESHLDKMGLIDKNSFLKVYEMFLRGDRRIWYIDISRFLIAELWAKKLAL